VPPWFCVTVSNFSIEAILAFSSAATNYGSMKHTDIEAQHWVWLLAGIGLLALAWEGSVDTISQGYVGDSLLDAGIIYGTARGINALVSALQGTELDMWLVTFSIGELLDPVNDVIERFSAVMTLAIASMVIQQLLLTIVSDSTFSILLSLLAVAAVLAFVLARTQAFQLLLRTFLVVAFLRFALAFVVLANLWVDQVFLPDSAGADHAVMQEFYGELEGVDEVVRGDGERSRLPDMFDELQAQIDSFVDGTLRLLGAMLLKSLIIPLLFMYGLLQLFRGLFATIKT